MPIAIWNAQNALKKNHSFITDSISFLNLKDYFIKISFNFNFELTAQLLLQLCLTFVIVFNHFPDMIASFVTILARGFCGVVSSPHSCSYHNPMSNLEIQALNSAFSCFKIVYLLITREYKGLTSSGENQSILADFATCQATIQYIYYIVMQLL